MRRLDVDVCNRKSKVLQYDFDSRGYPKVTLYYNGVRKSIFVHRLVAKAFLPNPLGLPEVNHTGDNGDCRACKLEWRTKQGNMQHAVKTGRKHGEGVYFKKTANKWVATYCPEPNQGRHLVPFNKESSTGCTQSCDRDFTNSFVRRTMAQAIPAELVKSAAMKLVISQGWSWQGPNGGQINIETCPFCRKADFKFYIAVCDPEESTRDGLFMCHHGSCQKTGNLRTLQEQLGLRVVGVDSRKEWAGSKGEQEALPDADLCHATLA